MKGTGKKLESFYAKTEHKSIVFPKPPEQLIKRMGRRLFVLEKATSAGINVG